jgi:hypothetical protein
VTQALLPPLGTSLRGWRRVRQRQDIVAGVIQNAIALDPVIAPVHPFPADGEGRLHTQAAIRQDLDVLKRQGLQRGKPREQGRGGDRVVGAKQGRQRLRQVHGNDEVVLPDFADFYACVKSGMVTEQLLPRAVAALNELMALTPVEELPDLPTDAEFMTGPPEDEALWSQDMTRRIRLFSGI